MINTEGEEPISKRTRSKHITFEDNSVELGNDIVGAYYIGLPNNENLTESSVFRVEIPAKHHGRPDVVEAKKK